MLSFRRAFVTSMITGCAVGSFGCAEGVDPSRSDSGSTSTGAATGNGGFVGTAGSAGSGLTSFGTGGSSFGTGGATPTAGGAGSLGTGGGTSGAGGGIGSGGTAATGGAPPFDAGPPAVGVLVAQYKSGDADPKDGNLKPQFNLVNRSTRSIPLAALTIRYFYTIDGSPAPGATDYQQLWLDYADISRITNGRTTVKLSFGKLAKPEPGADHYIEVAFEGGDSLAPGAATNQIQVRANWPNYTVNYDETNDYSWNGAITTFTDWRKVTVHQNGVLVWGTEPDGTTPKVLPDGGTDAAPADASTPPADGAPRRDAGRD